MKNSDGWSNPRCIILICVTFLVLASLPILSRAHASSTAVNIVNNSSKGIRNVYTSHVDADDWSADLLGDATIAPGQSSNLSNVPCDGEQMKLIAEDDDGCFLYTVISCSQNSSWTVADDTTKDCGY